MYHVKLTQQIAQFYSLLIKMSLDKISIFQNDTLTQSIVFHFKEYWCEGLTVMF